MIELKNELTTPFGNNKLYQRFARLMLSWPMLIAIFSGNAIGAVAGLIYWYGDQLQAAPWYLWIFIPDSPASTFWVIPALLLILWRPPGWPWFNAFAAFGIIKYGLWTVIFWSLHWQSGGSVTFENIAMTFTHLVMAGEGLLLLGYTRLTTKVAIGLGGWFILNDLIDYGPLQTRPGLPPSVAVSTMMWVAFGLTLTLAGLYLWLAKTTHKHHQEYHNND